MESRTSRIRLLGHEKRSTGWIAVSKLNVVAQKRRSRPTKLCDEVLVDDRMKLGGLCCPMSKDDGTKFLVFLVVNCILLFFIYM